MLEQSEDATADQVSSSQASRPQLVRTFGWTLIGMLLLQSAWILAVPPFRGIDEHDHAYKAMAVAHGDWSATHRPSPQGWGEFVRVPRDLVEAATPECTELPYTTDDNCRPGAEGEDGLVEVSSSAARYNPVFYYLVGTPATHFTGAHSLYAMRIAAALLCALLVAAAITTTRSWARTSFPLMAILLSLTPTMVYSTAMAAPNGVEMAAALLTWSALLGLARVRSTSRNVGSYLLVAVTGMVPLVSVRTLGPLWLALILIAFLALTGLRSVLPLLRTRVARASAATVVTASILAVLWSLRAGTNSLPDDKDIPAHADFPALGPMLLKHLVLWPLQAIGAFPSRNEAAPLSLYAISLTVLSVALVVIVRHSTRRERFAMAVVVGFSLAVPALFMVRTYEQLGTIWQGRYGYPLAMGMILIGGLALDRRVRVSAPISLLAAGSCLVSLGLTQYIGAAGVLTGERDDSPLAGTNAWIDAPPWFLGLLVAAGCTALAAAVLGRTARPVPAHQRRPSIEQ